MIKKFIFAAALLVCAVPLQASTPIRKMFMAEVNSPGQHEVGPINFSTQMLSPSNPSAYLVVTEFKSSNLWPMQHQTVVQSDALETTIRVFWQ